MKWIKVLLGVAAVALAVIIGLQIGIQMEAARAAQAADERQVSEIKIALVNQDDGVEVNGKPYHYASSVIENLDDTYVLVSYQAAQDGFQSGQYSGLVIFPSNLSQNVTTIDSQTPQAIDIQYSVNEYLPEDQYLEAYTDILKLQNTLSHTFSYLYVRNFYDRLHDAQDKTAQVLQNDSESLAALEQVKLQDFTQQVNFTPLTQADFELAQPDLTEQLQGVLNSSDQLNETYLNSYRSAERDYRSMVQAMSRLAATAGVQFLEDNPDAADTQKPSQSLNASAPSHNSAPSSSVSAQPDASATGESVPSAPATSAGTTVAGTKVDAFGQLGKFDMQSISDAIKGSGSASSSESASAESNATAEPPAASVETTTPNTGADTSTPSADASIQEETGAQSGPAAVDDQTHLVGDYQLTNPRVIKSMSKEELAEIIVRMMHQTQQYDPASYLTGVTKNEATAQIQAIQEAIQNAGASAQEAQDQNVGQMNRFYQQANEYILSLQQQATQANQEAQAGLGSSLQTFYQAIGANNAQNKTLLNDFSNMLPNSRIQSQINQDVVNFTVNPVQSADLNIRATQSADASGRVATLTQMQYITFGLIVLIVVLSILALAFYLRQRAREQEAQTLSEVYQYAQSK